MNTPAFFAVDDLTLRPGAGADVRGLVGMGGGWLALMAPANKKSARTRKVTAAIPISSVDSLRLLLRQAVKRAQSQGECGGRQRNDLAIGKTLRQYLAGTPIERILESGHQHAPVDDIEIGIAGGQALRPEVLGGRPGQRNHGQVAVTRSTHGCGALFSRSIRPSGPVTATIVERSTKRAIWSMCPSVSSPGISPVSQMICSTLR